MPTDGPIIEIPERPPRDNILRGLRAGMELRSESADDGSIGTLTGHFSTFGSWYEIDSLWEGRFLERVVPGAFKKTFVENRDAMRVTFNHGQDPQLGDKVLGPIATLEEDAVGAYYEVPLFDTSYNRDLLPGLKAGAYGSSFRFRVMREEFEQKPRASDVNPEALPERTIKEAQVMEFGPVTFPASPSASAAVRSLTDRFILDRFAQDPRGLRELVETMRHNGSAPSEADAGAEPHLEPERRTDPPVDAEAPPHLDAPAPKRFSTRQEYLEWISRI